MEVRDFFVQRNYKISDLGKGKDYVFSDELISLIKNEEVKDYVIKKYELEKKVKINFEKIDLLVPLVRKYVDRFSMMRIQATEDNVTTSFTNNTLSDVKFEIRAGIVDGAEIDELSAIAIYDSINMFYNSRKLSQYVNFLKKKRPSPTLLSAVNQSWQQYYSDKNTKLNPRVFRVLYDNDDDIYYLKGINSEKYKEYGISETFVLTILELHRLSLINKQEFKISSIALSESKIEIILRESQSTYIRELGYIHSSISIRNQDQGNTSIGVYSSLEFKLANEDQNGKLHFFPNKEVKGIRLSEKFNHTVTTKYFVDSYSNISEFFQDVDSFKNDFYFLKDSTSPDQLRAKIEEKIVSNRSPFRGILA